MECCGVRVGVSILILILMDILAAVLGYEAELAQDKVKHVKVLFIECEKGGSNPALMLGYAAAVCFVVAHLAAHSAGDLWSCTAAVCFSQLVICVLFFAWVAWLVGASLLYFGAKGNKRHGAKCGISHHGFLKWGAFICCVHLVTSLLYCFLSHDPCNLFMKAVVPSNKAPKVATNV